MRVGDGDDTYQVDNASDVLIEAVGEGSDEARSRVSYTLSGDATFTNPALPTLPPALAPVVSALANAVNTNALYNSGISSGVKMPELVNISFFRSMGSWDFMADAQWTGWSAIRT